MKSYSVGGIAFSFSKQIAYRFKNLFEREVFSLIKWSDNNFERVKVDWLINYTFNNRKR